MSARTGQACSRAPEEDVIATVARTFGAHPAPSTGFTESYVPEDLVLQTARSLAAEVGLGAVSPGAGALLRLLAAVGPAKAVVEIGTGTGVSGVWLLRGMRPDGVLTTIDVENEHQRVARRIFLEAGFAPSRTRIITGRALDVLPRLADGVYDLVFVDADATESGACADAALRLLRPGGVLAVNGALAGGRIADPAARDVATVTVRQMVTAVRESDEWIEALVPAGEGLLVAVKR
ncbi:O-methyltransferase [Spirilliplanes yamanashiensis]|uniref:O-methyltransferase n=1 Tax=Spirilliplanes yamanashiensis TaxID=42233 RepID=A0A8J4DFU3_9ACTN|nr:O-methyltransferase [Spirilliplanes yamanashiensis]MDP9814286.1 putative O-methyltransferase YrrM [Spirilliplanes yamanashiensis]GIJ00731.1 O-methyltransferase [Spirilliplanes yamanashiensis]